MIVVLWYSEDSGVTRADSGDNRGEINIGWESGHPLAVYLARVCIFAAWPLLGVKHSESGVCDDIFIALLCIVLVYWYLWFIVKLISRAVHVFLILVVTILNK